MKPIILVLLGLGLCLQAKSASLSTMDGTTYNNITAQRVDPDGLYIEYALPGGGLGMSKVKFIRLSPDQQTKFGYDENKAKDFEAKVAKAEEDFRQESIRSEQIAQAQRLARQNREDQQAQILNDRISSMAQLKQSEAELAGAEGDNGGGWYSGGGGWYSGGYGLIGLPEFGNIRGGRNEFGFGFRRNGRELGQGIHRPGHYPINNPSISITKRLANEKGL